MKVASGLNTEDLKSGEETTDIHLLCIFPTVRTYQSRPKAILCLKLGTFGPNTGVGA